MSLLSLIVMQEWVWVVTEEVGGGRVTPLGVSEQTKWVSVSFQERER